jgi:alpha-beta hydrolase superfamily lysophospholipase
MDFKETASAVIDLGDGAKTFARIWEPGSKPKAVFIAVHGGMAHSGDWVTPALYFAKKGIATVAYELRGHGMYRKYNPGAKLLLHVDSFADYRADMDSVVAWTAKRYPGVPIFILAHSLGGLIALNWELSDSKVKRQVKGYAISAPWLKNLVGIPAVLAALAKVFSVIWPTFASKTDLSVDVLTHDPEITRRHHADEKAELRATKGTARFLVEATRAQEWTSAHMAEWKKHPLFVVTAGQDKLADSAHAQEVLKKVPKKLLTLKTYDRNYHENFNELNRAEIFDGIYSWMTPLMKG